jgi:hypothetical protein
VYDRWPEIKFAKCNTRRDALSEMYHFDALKLLVMSQESSIGSIRGYGTDQFAKGPLLKLPFP